MGTFVPVLFYLKNPGFEPCLEKSEKRRVQAAGNGPGEDGKCWQRVELGIHSLNRWLVKY